MEDFKLIFYIGVAIAWVVYKNYQKVQQNRPKTIQPPVANPETVTNKKTLSDLILERNNQNKKDTVIRKPEIKREYKAAEKIKESKKFLKDEIKKKAPATSPFLNTETIYAGAPTIAVEKKEMDKSTEAKKNLEEDLFDVKKFDIRTAIIYSEILKRPYV